VIYKLLLKYIIKQVLENILEQLWITCEDLPVCQFAGKKLL